MAVEALVMMEHDLGDLRVADADAAEQLRAVARVELDDRELAIGQPAGLVQDLARRVDLADVVHERGRLDLADLARGETQLARDPAGVGGDPATVSVHVRVDFLELV